MEVLVPALVGLLLGKPMIGALARFNIRQSIYAYAPDTHRAKEGTPTMGGFIMLLGVAIGLVTLALMPAPPHSPTLFSRLHLVEGVSVRLYLLPLLALFASALLFALLGFLDDYLVRRWLERRGLEWKIKLLLQFLVATVALYLMATVPVQLMESVPPALPQAPRGDGGVISWLVGLVWVVGWVNAFNLTDGLDGLAAGLSVIAFGLLASMCRDTISILTALLWCGAALGYLWWNLHPARVFMGDTGSMALGATFGLITWREIGVAHWLEPGGWGLQVGVSVLIGLVFAAEIVSVVVQLSAVKLLRRRLFRATPIHHHFELLGWQESTIVGRFWLVGALAGITAYMLSGGTR
jgi:phospho-N-acetylmuramoyl-pentapeptide-transferase